MSDLLYSVRLESQEHEGHYRTFTCAAPDENIAAAKAFRKEQELVSFSLTPKPPEEPKRPDSNDVTVLAQYLTQMDRFHREKQSYEALYANADSADEMRRKLDDSGHKVAEDGTVTGPTRRGKAHLAAALQEKPYEISRVETIIPSVPDTIMLLKMIHSDAKAWDEAVKAMKAAGIPTAVLGSLFGLQMQKQLDGSAPIVWSSATMKVALTTVTWSPAQDTHDFFNDVTNELAAAGGYPAGGWTLANKTSNYNSTTDQAWLDADNVVQANATFTARRAALYSDTGGASSTDPLWGHVDFEADQSPSNGTFTIAWDATGIIIVDVT